MLNTDGAFSSVTGRGGWGALARDNDGDLIIAEAGSVPAAIDALHVETFAVLKAITMATRLGFGRIIVATDCQTLQRAITSSEYDMSELGALFREANFLLETEFLDFH
jgi:ribonuclease HI